MKIKSLLKLKSNPFNEWNAEERVLSDDITIIEMRHKTDPIYWPIIAIFMKNPWRVIITGDYGNWSWDELTWEPSIHNLPYQNLSYLSEKLSSESKEIYQLYYEELAQKDIYKYIKDLFKDNDKFDIPFSTTLWKILNAPLWDCSLDDFCERRNVSHETKEALELLRGLLLSIDSEEELIGYLQAHSHEFEEYVESDFCESVLWHTGRDYSKHYLYSLLALETASKQLKKKSNRKQKKSCEDE